MLSQLWSAVAAPALLQRLPQRRWKLLLHHWLHLLTDVAEIVCQPVRLLLRCQLLTDKAGQCERGALAALSRSVAELTNSAVGRGSLALKHLTFDLLNVLLGLASACRQTAA